MRCLPHHLVALGLRQGSTLFDFMLCCIEENCSVQCSPSENMYFFISFKWDFGLNWSECKIITNCKIIYFSFQPCADLHHFFASNTGGGILRKPIIEIFWSWISPAIKLVGPWNLLIRVSYSPNYKTVISGKITCWEGEQFPLKGIVHILYGILNWDSCLIIFVGLHFKTFNCKFTMTRQLYEAFCQQILCLFVLSCLSPTCTSKR